MEFGILGAFEVASHGERLDFRASRERTLLALLVLNVNRIVASERLADELWSGAPPEGASKTLRVYVSRVRQGLGDEGNLIVTRPGGYLLEADPRAIDAVRFEGLVAQGREQAAGGNYGMAAGTLREALALWRGSALADVVDAPSAQAEAARLEEARLAALEDRIEADLACGRHGELAAELDALIRGHPLREHLWAQRMTALYRAGRQAEALRAYQELRRTLGEQLGIEPSSAVQRLETAILRHDPELDWHPPEGTAPQTPLRAGSLAEAGRSGPAASAEGVVTFLFTDMVGSTELLAQLGEDAADETRRAHFSLLREAVAAYGGTEIKSLGDGLMVTFTSPLAALECAVTMQEAVAREGRRQTRPLAVRIGLHAGEPVRDEGDFFGTPVVVAKRLCDRAEGGQILASALVRDLAGGRGEHAFTFRSLGGLTLKGLAELVAACEVAWGPTPEEASPVAAGPGPLPLPLGREERFPLVGRSGELVRLQGAWAAARSGRRQLVLLAGEPGIGKTRLTADFARQAYAEEAMVLFGRCDEGMGVPYQPFVEALGRYVREAPAPVLGRLAGELVRLVPEVAERIRGLSPPLRSEPETERYRLFDALVAWLSAASEVAPVLLVLDDLHWATKPTLLLLRHLVRSDEPLSLLAVATYRDSPLDMTADLADALVEMLRQPGVERVTLTGLDEEGVAALMEAQARHELDDEARALAAVLHAETAGNPFFVREMLRHLAEKGAIAHRQGRWVAAQPAAQVDVPDSVREVVGRRVTHLPDETVEALAMAAVLGERFELAVLAEASGGPETTVTLALRPAVAARLIEETGVGRYHFGHALVRSTLEDALGPTRRAQLHRAAGLAVETVHAKDLDDHLPELVHHFTRADDRARAVHYASLAGDRALAQFANDEAVTYYRRALEVLEAAEGPSDDRARVRLLISLGEAERRAGDPAHREHLLEAARLAQEQRDAESLARAALANCRGAFSAAGRVDAERVRLLEVAIEATGDQHDALRAPLLANLGMELTFGASLERRMELTGEAVALARGLGDLDILSSVLASRASAIWDASTISERLEITAEAVAIGKRVGNPLATYWGLLRRFSALLELGSVEEAGRHMTAADQAAQELGQPFLRAQATFLRATWLMVVGRLKEAEQVSRTALALGEQVAQPDARLFFVFQLYSIRYQQARVDDTLAGQLAMVSELSPSFPLVAAMMADVQLDLGRVEDARTRFDAVAAGNFSNVLRNNAWSPTMAVAARVCVALGDQERATILYDLMVPYEDLVSAHALMWFGAFNHHLGILDVTLGRFDDAAERFAAAASTHDRAGAQCSKASTQLEWGRVLLVRRRPGDAARGRELLSHALSSARKLRLAGVERQAAELLA